MIVSESPVEILLLLFFALLIQGKIVNMFLFYITYLQTSIK